MKRYTYNDLILARRTKHSYTKQVEHRIKELLNQKVFKESTLFKILFLEYKTVEPLELLLIIQNTLQKEGTSSW